MDEMVWIGECAENGTNNQGRKENSFPCIRMLEDLH